MVDLDMSWMVLGLFLLACGGLPAILAHLSEKRDRHGAAGAVPVLFHEAVQAAGPAELARLREAVALPRRAAVES